MRVSRELTRDPSVEVFPQFRCPYTMPKGRARILLDASFRFVLSLFSPSLFLLSLSLSFSRPSYSVAFVGTFPTKLLATTISLCSVNFVESFLRRDKKTW